MYDKKFISVMPHALDPPPVTNCHSFSDPSSVTYFMDGPVVADKLLKVSVFLCIFRTFKFILTSLDELF